MAETTSNEQSSTFRKGYGWTPALDDTDARVRQAARSLLYGITSGKVRRYGITRARPVRHKAALDGDVDRFLALLAGDGEARRAWRRRILQAHGITFEDVRRVTTIKGRPSTELAPLRRRVEKAF